MFPPSLLDRTRETVYRDIPEGYARGLPRSPEPPVPEPFRLEAISPIHRDIIDRPEGFSRCQKGSQTTIDGLAPRLQSIDPHHQDWPPDSHQQDRSPPDPLGKTPH